MLFSRTLIYSQIETRFEKIDATPDGLMDQILDSRGVKYKLIDLLIDNGTNATAINVGCSTTSYFNLYYETGCGMDDATNPVHMQRRTVLCKVFAKVNSVILKE